MSHVTCFHQLKAKMIIGKISQNMVCAGENRLFQVVFNQALVWYFLQEMNTGCKVWCYVMSQKWTCGQQNQPPQPQTLSSTVSLPPSLIHSLIHLLTFSVHAWPGKSSVCVCMLFHACWIHTHTYSHQFSPPHWWLWLVVCVSVFFKGWCRKDTLTNQSLDFLPRQAHRDLEFSRMTVWSQNPA